ncbi:MAG: hypothetical protein AB1503_10180 [Bacillota bacterium]|nr:hypothetical protein [Bacillota bacterium]
MDNIHIALGLAVTVAGLVAAMSILFALSKVVDLASRQRELNQGRNVDAARVAPQAAHAAPPYAAEEDARDESGYAETDVTGTTAREQGAYVASSDRTPARSRSLHLHLRLAGSDYDVEVQQVGQAA